MCKIGPSFIFILLSLCSGNLLAQVPTNGLIGFYPFNGNANDESGTGNHGIIHGASLTEDRCGVPNSAYLFDGNNDYIELDPDFISSNAHGTIAAWVKFNSLSRTQYLGCIADEQSIDYYISLLRYDPNSQTMSVFQRYPGFANIVTGNTHILPNVYYFVAMTADGNEWNIYVNGNRESLTMASGSNSGEWASSVQGVDNWLLGCIRILQPYDQAFLDGTMDDIRFYNRALTHEEILRLYFSDCMVLNIIGDSIACKNQQNVFYSVSHIDNATYSWTYSGNDAVIEDNGNSILIDFGANATDGTLSVTVSGSSIITQVQSMDISIRSLPLMAGAISGLREVCQESGSDYSVMTIPEATEYQWLYTGTGILMSGTGSVISIYFTETASAGMLTVTGSNSCGSGATSVEFLISPQSCYAPGKFNIPNSFTPNGDGVNDIFYIEGLIDNSSISIYDREGRLLFRSSNYQNDWNGMDKNGNQLETNTYWYVLNMPGYPSAFKGYIYLKR